MVNRLYHTDVATLKYYELDPDTFLDISGGGVSVIGGDTPGGIGGAGARLYTTSAVGSDKLFEIDPDTLLDISGGGVVGPGGTPGGGPVQIGGMSARLYVGDNNVRKYFEIDPDTLLDISSGGFSSGAAGNAIRGLGGLKSSDRLYACRVDVAPLQFEYDPDTFAELNTETLTDTQMGGTGGTSTRLYAGGRTNDKIFELDPDTLLDISSGGVNSPGTNPIDVGGIVIESLGGSINTKSGLSSVNRLRLSI